MHLKAQREGDDFLVRVNYYCLFDLWIQFFTLLCFPQAMLKRLQGVRPVYKMAEWVSDWEKKEQLVENITAYPTSSRASSAKRTHIQAAISNKVRERGCLCM